MTHGNRDLARKLLLLEGDGTAQATSSIEVAASARKIWEKLSDQFVALLGDAGIRTLLDRSLVLSSVSYPCLATARRSVIGAASMSTALHDCLARETPEQAIEAFVGLFAGTVELLGRFVGDVLVLGVLNQVWPSVFPLVKETP